MRNSQNAVLKFKTGENSWRNLPENIWRKLLVGYFFELADSFGFEDAKNCDELRTDSIFNFLEVKDLVLVKAAEQQQSSALFQLNERTKEAIAFPIYGNWLIWTENFNRNPCVLVFFSSLDPVAACSQSEIEFYGLDAELYKLLCAVDPSIAMNLWVDYEMKRLYRPRA